MNRVSVVVTLGLCVLAACSFSPNLTRLSAEGPASQPAGELALDLGNQVTMKLVLIPAGKFQMGSPAGEQGRNPNEGPQHEVTITKPFYMGVCEVSLGQYQALMGKKAADADTANSEAAVANISWDDAAKFCAKMSAKTGKTVSLPTEAQWEYACRAGSNTRFHYGDDNGNEKLVDYAWYNKTSGGLAHPGGQKKPNAWGLFDMHGNVSEWCADWYADSYAGAGAVDPQGPATGTARVLRGGSWDDDAPDCRCAYRFSIAPGDRSIGYGFRVVVDAK
ncbi:MAG: formylglycine-generating enzyme family protein [Planctomycetota bacterium]|nr:formylglycine-generating enzyme family protein [Planctomycetota bacterium]